MATIWHISTLLSWLEDNGYSYTCQQGIYDQETMFRNHLTIYNRAGFLFRSCLSDEFDAGLFMEKAFPNRPILAQGEIHDNSD